MDLRAKQPQAGIVFIVETSSHDILMSMAWAFYTSRFLKIYFSIIVENLQVKFQLYNIMIRHLYNL